MKSVRRYRKMRITDKADRLSANGKPKEGNREVNSVYHKAILGVMVLLLFVSSMAFISAGGLSDIFGEKDARNAALRVVPGEVSEVELEDGIYEVDVLSADGEKEVSVNQLGEVVGVEDEEIDEPITGNALDRASSAALDYIGEGRVTDSEIGDEEGYYEIEITMDNGQEADVHLDENFNVLSVEYD
jgi:uncharacterized membrane protein YkoI